MGTVRHAAARGSSDLHIDSPSTAKSAQPPAQPDIGATQWGNGDRVAIAATAPAQRPAAGEAQHG